MAKDIIAKSPTNLNIIAHSFGSYETLDLVKELLKQNYQGTIQVEFIGTPGLLNQGFPALIKFGKRVSEMARQVTINEQHVFYPLPDVFYRDDKRKDSTAIVWSDTDQERQKRREKFKQNLLKTVPETEKREKIITELELIDKQLVDKTDDKLYETLLAERIEILAPLLQDVFRGKHLEESEHRAFLEYYGENPENLTSNLGFLAQTLGYCGGIFKRIYKGLNKEISLLHNQAEKAKVKLNFGFVTLENDTIIKQEDLQNLNIEDLTNFGFIEQLAHSSIGYYPEPMAAIFSQSV
jgi:hypothetical protein